jgi:AAA family ATP:ADP antiporter
MASAAARVLETLLHLRRGDLARGALLFAHLFLVICAYVVGQVVRDSLFLDRFPASMLPFVDIGSVLLVGTVAAIYIRAGRRATLRSLVVGSLAVFAATGLLLFWLVVERVGASLFAVVYVWIGVFGVLAPAQVWTLANYALSPREAKRLFGLLGSGATSGAIAGGFVSSFIARRLGVESLLLVVAFCIAGAAVAAEALWRRRLSVSEEGRARPAAAAGEGPRSLGESLRLILASPALRSLAGLIVVSSFVTSVVGWQFKAVAQQVLVHKEALAPFFGTLNGVVGVLAVLTQVLVTPRVLKGLELGIVLLVLPLTLAAGSLGLVVFGTLGAAVALRVGDKVLRYSIDRPAVELLYLPLPPGLKVQVKSFIDTVVWRLGDGLAGLSVLVLVTLLGVGPLRMSFVALLALVLWLSLAVRSRRRYVALLRDAIHQHRLDAERAAAPVLDRSTTEIFGAGLHSVDPREILYALDLLTVGDRPAHHPAIRGLLGHDSPEVRERALAILSAAGDRSVLGEVEGLLRDPHPGVRTEALLYLSKHSTVDPVTRLEELKDFPEYGVRAAVVAVLARSGEENLELARAMLHAMATEPGPEGARARLEAVRLAAALEEPLAGPLGRLILDPDPEVASAAIGAAARLGAGSFVRPLLRRLADPRLGSEAASALVAVGEGVVGPLGEALGSERSPLELRREIPPLLTAIGSPAAARLLLEHLLEPDGVLRTRVISALNALVRDHPQIPLDGALLETALAAEILGQYRSHQILAGLAGRDDDPAIQGLREAMGQEVERIFRLLALVFPGHDFHSAFVGLRSPSPVVRGQALDFLESVLRPPMRRLLIPLVDGDIGAAERARLAERMVGHEVGGPAEAVEALAGSHDPWLRSCAAYAIGAFGLQGMAARLDEWAADPDPLLRETVRQARERLDSGTGPIPSLRDVRARYPRAHGE